MKRPPNRPAAPNTANSTTDAKGARARSPRFGPRRDMLALESRIVFDGAAAGAGPGDLVLLREGGGHAFEQRLAGVAPDQRIAPEQRLAPDAPATDGAAATGAGRSVLIVDNRVPDYQKIVAAAGAGVIVIVVDKDSDGVDQIAAALKGLSGLDSISIVSHGDEGMLLLGDAALVGHNLADYSAQLAAIGAALGADGELLLYGCEAGNGAEGRAFLEALAGMTGAVVAASSDATGGAARGGDWELEISTGTVTAGAAFDAAALAGYEHLLVTTSVGTLAALKAAIATGNSDGVADLITITANIDFTVATDTLAINVTDGQLMTIIGGGKTLDAKYLARAMTTASTGAGSAIEIENLTITHGLVSGAGGDTGVNGVAGGDALGAAISNTGTLTLNSVTITANAATGGGGGGGGGSTSGRRRRRRRRWRRQCHWRRQRRRRRCLTRRQRRHGQRRPWRRFWLLWGPRRLGNGRRHRLCTGWLCRRRRRRHRHCRRRHHRRRRRRLGFRQQRRQRRQRGRRDLQFGHAEHLRRLHRNQQRRCGRRRRGRRGRLQACRHWRAGGRRDLERGRG
nr:DUF4347 domain-containing protein [Massilia glaciei]